MKNKDYVPYGIIIIAFIVLFLIAPIVFKVFNFEILPSQFFGALIGVFITTIVTAFLLRGQTEGNENREKSVRIYSEKIQVYSEFSSKIWNFFYENQTMKKEEMYDNYDKLRIMCFDKLVFFLEEKYIERLTTVIKEINASAVLNNSYESICKITDILQESLHNKDKKEKSKKEKTDLLKDLYEAFKQDDKEEKKEIVVSENNQSSVKNITFWHFNMLDEKKQLKAFENGNWILNLIEYDEDRRTNLLKQVRTDDVVFLFRRGGYGYIGAFKVTGKKILNDKEYKNKKYSDKEISDFDIYDALEDGATWVSNLIVIPIAYNYRGVGCLTVRRRTIERMNDTDSYKFLIKRFNGDELTDEQKARNGKLTKELKDKNIKIDNLDSEYFNLIKDYYLK